MNEYEMNHLQYLRGHLAECTVLLKNNGDFPLETPCKIATYGCGVRRTVKGGTGSGEVNSRFFVTVEEGLEKAGFTITSKGWLDAYEQMYASRCLKRPMQNPQDAILYQDILRFFQVSYLQVSVFFNVLT